MEAGDFSQVSSWQKTTDKIPIKTCRIMTFTGSQFRDKYELEPRTWYRNLHSVTEYFYFTGLISSKLVQIIYYKNGVEMI